MSVSLPKDQQDAATGAPPTAPAAPVAEEEPAQIVQETPKPIQEPVVAEPVPEAQKPTEEPQVTEEPQTAEPASEPAPPVRAPPTSWANLFAKTPVAAVMTLNGENDAAGEADTVAAAEGSTGVIPSTLKANATSVAEAIQSYKVGGAEHKNAFLEPRGLINTGNMCYMNSVRQILPICHSSPSNMSIGAPSTHVLLSFLRFSSSG